MHAQTWASYSAVYRFHSLSMRICRRADVRSGKMRRNTADISADVMGKMWMLQCGYATNEHMPITCFLCTFALNILLCLKWVGLVGST